MGVVVGLLAGAGKKVIVAGLDMDFRGEPFGPMPVLMAEAEAVTKLQAICVTCGRPGSRTQRLIDGKPASYDDPVIMVGASEVNHDVRDGTEANPNVRVHGGGTVDPPMGLIPKRGS